MFYTCFSFLPMRVASLAKRQSSSHLAPIAMPRSGLPSVCTASCTLVPAFVPLSKGFSSLIFTLLSCSAGVEPCAFASIRSSNQTRPCSFRQMRFFAVKATIQWFLHPAAGSTTYLCTQIVQLSLPLRSHRSRLSPCYCRSSFNLRYLLSLCFFFTVMVLAKKMEMTKVRNVWVKM